MRLSVSTGLLALVAMMPARSVAVAQPAASGIPRVTGPGRAAVIDSAIVRLERTYVEVDTGRLIGRKLRARLEAGAYDKADNPAQFAELVTSDLRSLNGDLHLSLRYAPNPQTGPARPFGADSRFLNFGLGKAEILDGNIGYLEITGFLAAPGYEDAVVDALRFLSRTDAVIIDVRRNGGGSGEMSHLVFSHFLGAEPVPTIKVRGRLRPEPAVRHSLASVPGPRRPDVPLYVLTSQATGSAAEEFSFVLKNLKRATIVGTRTAGAGHMVTFVPVGGGFVMGLSITRVSDPVTDKEWEQVGVQPDVAVPAESALSEAHLAALRAVLPKTTDPVRIRQLERLVALTDARLRPVATDPARLAVFAGGYEGGRVVSVVGGRLRYSRRAGAVDDLVPLGGDRFAVGTTQLRFEVDGSTVRLTVDPAEGTPTTVLRTPYSRVLAVNGAFFALSVADLGASTQWYAEKLGLRVIMQSPAGGPSTVTVLNGGGLTVELVQLAEARPFSVAAPSAKGPLFVHGIFKVGVVVDNYAEALDNLRARGVEVAMGPFPAREDQPANVIIRDNARNLIQILAR